MLVSGIDNRFTTGTIVHIVINLIELNDGGGDTIIFLLKINQLLTT